VHLPKQRTQNKAAVNIERHELRMGDIYLQHLMDKESCFCYKIDFNTRVYFGIGSLLQFGVTRVFFKIENLWVLYKVVPFSLFMLIS
jgi:hypothetical protein